MQIGSDFPKIEFQFLGLDLLEPNGFIGNFLIFSVSIFFFFKVRKLEKSGSSDFLRNWRLFYITFGFSFLLGGFSHLLYNYFEIAGKIPSWFLAMFAPFFIEQAMISIFPNKKKRTFFKKLSFYKLIVFVLLEAIVLINFDISEVPEKGLIIPSLCSALGLIISLGVLGLYYKKRIHNSFINLWFAMIVLFFSSLPQIFKINLHEYFDRNDLSHSLLIVSLILYYKTVKNHADFKLNALSVFNIQVKGAF